MQTEVIPEKRTGPGHDTFSYLVPEKLQSQIQVGSIVNVSFGRESIRGVIASTAKQSDSKDCHGLRPRNDKPTYKLKEIISIHSEFVIPEKYIETAKWISEYYLCSLGEAISLFLPPNIIRPRRITESRIENLESSKSIKITLTTEQKEIFEKLKEKLIYCSSLSRTKKESGSQSPEFIPNKIEGASNSKPALIFGVTGSGKTEIYLKLATETLKLKKQVVVLVPEIMLTPQTVQKFEEVFPDQICLMHSGLSRSEKYLSYRQFYNGEKSIIIGPRSALLVTSINIGLIIIDEEQEDAYKQEHDPRYHAVDLAEKIAESNNALLVLGTATPRVETFYKCHSRFSRESTILDPRRSLPRTQLRGGDDKTVEEDDCQYNLFKLSSRYQKLLLPPAKIVDLRNEIKQDNLSPISLELQSKIAEVLKNKRHIILFLNRRGMATFVSCRECGEVILCPKCNIPMVYHLYFGNDILNCHHCDYKTAVPKLCPECKSSKIKYFGAGVDKIESEIIRLFPKVRVRKIDAKSLQNKNEYMKLYDDFKSGKIDILIGTQILAKGLDIGTVDLVGIISADTGLHLPYFRANEKTFSILTQVSGRSGRRDNVGQTIIQTYWPDSIAIRMAADHNFEKFYEQEILERKEFNYPPFCHLIRVVSENKNEKMAKIELEKIATELKKEKIDFIGPAKCFLSKINNKYRYHLIIKASKLPNPKITEVFKTNPYLVWDVDPADLL